MVGALVGLTGVGGGSLMTPVLVLLFGFHPSTAVGTDLLYASVTKSVGTAVHGKQQTVDWRIVARLAAGSVPASIATLLVMSRVGTMTEDARGILNLLLGVSLLLTGISVFFRPARVAILPRIVPEEDLLSANSAMWVGETIADVIGFPLAGRKKIEIVVRTHTSG